MSSIIILLIILYQVYGSTITTDQVTLRLELSKNHYDEDGLLTVPQLITKYGYPVEQYYITTPDGYILKIHRIPYGRTNKNLQKVVYLQHGLLASSADWVISGPSRALGYLLADEGYDVWMGNVRGNRYSRNHTKLDPNTDGEFWNFSWHEIGYFDIPTIIDFILKTTKQKKLYHIGHSQGTTTFYVMTSLKPSYNKKIIAHFSLAPIAYMEHLTSPLVRILAFWEQPLVGLMDLIGVKEFLPSSQFLNLAGNLLCGDDDITQVLCKNALFAICGYSPKQLNASMLPTLMGHSPAGCSTRQIQHYGQEILSGRFRQYDFGWIINRFKYGSLWPPDYDLGKIIAPVFLFYSRNDWLSAEIDVMRLAKQLGNVKLKYLVPDHSFAHLDYTYGIGAKENVYDKIIKIITKFE